LIQIISEFNILHKRPAAKYFSFVGRPIQKGKLNSGTQVIDRAGLDNRGQQFNFFVLLPVVTLSVPFYPKNTPGSQVTSDGNRHNRPILIICKSTNGIIPL
jgi:hypothetical protein